MDQSKIDEMFGGSDGDLTTINHLSICFNDGIKGLDFYLDTLEEFIKSQEKKEVQHLQKTFEKTNRKHRGDFWEYNYPYYWKDIFEENLKESLVVSLLTMLEFHLNHICDFLCLKNDKFKKAKNFKNGDTIDKFRKCLQQFNPKLSSLNWGQIKILWRIRCIIAHNQGECKREEDKKLLKQFANKTNSISISNEYIRIDFLFCKNILRIIREFGTDLENIIRCYLTN